MPIWQPKYETLPHEELRVLQAERLRAVVARVHACVPLYRERLDAAGVSPADIRSLDDVRRLPFTVKDDFRAAYPFGLLAVPRRDIVRVHASSGTTGKATVVAYTRNDLAVWSDLVARILSMAGVTDESTVQVSFGYGLFTGGFGLHYGIERVGAAVVPASSGNTERQIQLIRDLDVTHIVATPSYAAHVCEVAQGLGLDLTKDTKLRTGCFGGEPWSESMRRALAHMYGLESYDNYGLSELIGPGVSGECEARRGLHVFEDHFYAEVVDPDTGDPLPPGEKGELVLTSLTREAMPVLRYRTKDITALDPAPCPCGRTSARMARAAGRTDDMLIIRGVNIFPTQVEHCLLETQGILPNYLLVVDRDGPLDTLEVRIEVTEEMLSDEMKNLNVLQQTLRDRLAGALQVRPRVSLVEKGTLPRSQGKAVRVVDNRPKEG